MKKQIIPKHAKQVFKGTVFDIYQWKQKMFDNSTHIFERAKKFNGVGVIATVGNKIVILKQKQPAIKEWFYSVAGGYLDKPGESPKAGALRELLEETGMKPEKIKLWKEFSHGGRVTSTTYFYIAQNCKKIAAQNLDSGEKIEIKLISFEQFLKLSDDPNFSNRDLIIEILKARLSKKAKEDFRKLIFN